MTIRPTPAEQAHAERVLQACYSVIAQACWALRTLPLKAIREGTAKAPEDPTRNAALSIVDAAIALVEAADQAGELVTTLEEHGAARQGGVA